MPTVLASAGTSSLIVLAVIAVGAMILAILFGQLTRRVPDSDGGPYAYAQHEFGDFAGYLTGWCYWIQAWAGNATCSASAAAAPSSPVPAMTTRARRGSHDFQRAI